MIPKNIIEGLIGVGVYIHIKDINEKFSGTLVKITDEGLAVLEDKYNNHTYIPISIIDVITERR